MMGTYLSIQGTLSKTKLTKTGTDISKYVENKENEPTLEEVKLALQMSEGCRLSGSILVLRVPGNFHISSHSHSRIISKLVEDGTYNFDLSHTINHISFGEEEDIRSIKRIFNTGILNPLDNSKMSHNHKSKMIDEYYLNVVPTTYIDLAGKNYNVHQFIANSNQVKANMLIPAIYFRFDLSPILVKYTQHRERVFQFFIQICAIVGGIYTVTSVILSFLINSLSILIKNKEK